MYIHAYAHKHVCTYICMYYIQIRKICQKKESMTKTKEQKRPSKEHDLKVVQGLHR
jgi:hypothetical protein